MAPIVAPMSAATAPTRNPNRKPPVTVRKVAPGSETATVAMSMPINARTDKKRCSVPERRWSSDNARAVQARCLVRPNQKGKNGQDDARQRQQPPVATPPTPAEGELRTSALYSRALASGTRLTGL